MDRLFLPGRRYAKTHTSQVSAQQVIKHGGKVLVLSLKDMDTLIAHGIQPTQIHLMGEPYPDKHKLVNRYAP